MKYVADSSGTQYVIAVRLIETEPPGFLQLATEPPYDLNSVTITFRPESLKFGYTVCMHSLFKQLRAGGKRKSDRDISSDPGIIGHVSIFRQGIEVVAAAYATGGTGQPGAILPLLYRAKVVTMQGDGMLLQGWERPLACDQPDMDENKQEWSVKLFAEPQPAPSASARLG